jgi:hypothetical protein
MLERRQECVFRGRQKPPEYESLDYADALTAGRTLFRVLCLSTLSNVHLHPC